MTTDGGLRKIFQQHLPEFHWQSVETWSTGQGVPDVNYCYDAKEGWIEFKQTENFSVDISPHQVAWIERRTRAGGRVFIAVRRKHEGGPRKGEATDELWLFFGAVARVLLRNSLTSIPLISRVLMTPGGPNRWNWPGIGQKLLT